MSAKLEHLGEDLHGRELFLLELRSWEAWPRDLVLPSEHFCLLVAGNARGADLEAIASFASGALGAGCVYACAWGPGCQRVHDAFDGRSNELTVHEKVVMTTWHGDESLREALTFLVKDALPSDPWIASCRASIIAVVDNNQWAADVRGLIEA